MIDENQSDENQSQVKQPPHYATVYPFETKEAIELILNNFTHGLTPYECYCLGCELKYRLRAGFKEGIDPLIDIGKALEYKDFREGKR